MTTAEKPRGRGRLPMYDWDAIEPHYRAGVRSMVSIAKEFGCTDVAIIKHAKKYGWPLHPRRRYLSEKKQQFAANLAAGMSKTTAYAAAFGKETITSSVATMATFAAGLPEVQDLAASIRAPVLKAAQYGFAAAMDEAAEALAMAKHKENGGAMVAAVTLRAKLAGLLVEKREVRSGPLDGLPVTELEALDAAVSAIRKARVAV